MTSRDNAEEPHHKDPLGNLTEPLLSLTPAQEGHVRVYLDEQLASLSRDQRKHNLGPLSKLLSRLVPLLHSILQIPAIEPWASTRIAYLLAYTAVVVPYISPLPLIDVERGAQRRREVGEAGEAEEDEREEQEANDNLRCVLDLIRLVDRGWVAVLAGQGWVASPDGDGRAVTVQGGAKVDQTSRVRLSSIAGIAREQLLAWARPYGNFGGEVMGPDGDEGEVVPDDEKVGWEHEVLTMWSGMEAALRCDDMDTGM